MKRVTHKDIALRLDLNQSTVSRGLGDDPRIPLETRKRVQALAQEMGYRPDPLLSELAGLGWDSNKVASGTVIAYIVRADFDDYVKYERLTSQATRLGYHLEVFRRADFPSSAKLQAVLRSRGITDVILGPILEKSLMVELDWSKFIAVQIQPGFFPLPLHSVAKDHFNSVVLAWQKAVNYGYKRIGVTLMLHEHRLMDDVIRRSGVDACQKYLFPGLAALPPFLFLQRDYREKAFLGWAKKHKPDVIIGFNGYYRDLYREELPDELAYACLHTTESLGLSGIVDPSNALGKEGVNLLHFCRRTYQWGIPLERIDHIIEPRWFEGNSMPRKAAH